MIRYFCVVAPGAAGDVPFAYLEALAWTGYQVRAQAIGLAAFVEHRWAHISHLFTTPMRHPYVNVVCAPPGLMLGTKLPAAALAPTRAEGGAEALAKLERAMGKPLEASGRSELIYHPESALVGLLTVGCKNVAITSSYPALSDAELLALRRYDLILTPGAIDREVLAQRLLALSDDSGQIRQPPVVHVMPRAERLRALFDDLCESSTSATGARSRGSVAPAATTSAAWTGPATRSRSSTGRRFQALPLPPPDLLVPKVATPISTVSSSLGPWARLRSMWRSCMASLRSWLRWRPRRH